MAQDMVWLGRHALPAHEAQVSIFDLGFLRGIAAFESLRTYAGQPHGLRDHLARLWTTCAQFGLAPLHDDSTVRAQIAELHQRSGHDEVRINFVVTPGLNTDGLFGHAEQPTWVIIARRLVLPPPDWYTTGVGVVTFRGQRVLPELKTTNYLSGQEGIRAAQAAGAVEALYVDAAGQVSEGVTSNLLVVRGGRICEASEACLPGITKQHLAELAIEEGILWQQEVLRRDDLLSADEVWLTSSIRELMPVVRVDGQIIGDGRPGPLAQRLIPRFHARCAAAARRDAGGS